MPDELRGGFDLVYFQQSIHPDRDWIRIGRSSGSGKREDDQDEFEPIAVIRGIYDDEVALHEWFAPSRVTRRHDKSTYSSPELTEYVIWLLDRHYAGRDRHEAERLPHLPYSVWRPSEQRHEGRQGELSLFALLPQRDRISYARSDYIHLSSASDDWYTPDHIIDLARKAMGSIDLDPATCVAAQRRIGATIWYTKALDGLRTDLPWRGNVWLNPPYGRGESSASAFITRLLRELEAGHVSQAVTCLSLDSSSAAWFQPIWDSAAAHLIWRGRVNFWKEDKVPTSPSKGTILSYFGRHPETFAGAFAPWGTVIHAQHAGVTV